MRRSTDRILTTHVGSLVRPPDVLEDILLTVAGNHVDATAFNEKVKAGVTEVVRKQAEIGIDIPSDGEFSKPTFTSYVSERLSGLGPTPPTAKPYNYAKLTEEFPGFMKQYNAMYIPMWMPPSEGVTVHKDGTASANGMTRDRQRRLVVCHHISRCVDREETDGSVTVIADRYRGLRFNRPNDVVVRTDGSIYFTDPPTRIPLIPPDHYPEIDAAGVYRVSADLSRVNMIISRFVNPNGLCFSPDEKTLYVNGSNPNRELIMAYDVEASGFPHLGSERLFCDMKGDPRRGGRTA
jgi:hypothetical protein